MTDANPHPALLLTVNKRDLGQILVYSPLNYSFTGQQNSSHLFAADSHWFHLKITTQSQPILGILGGGAKSKP